MAVLIFDIDGTLVQSNEFDSLLYIKAVKSILGEVEIYDDWPKYHDVTDSGILSQIIKDNRLPDNGNLESKVRTKFGQLIRNHLADFPCQPIDGALEAISELMANSEHSIGIATGGWGHTAQLKLESAGFNIGSIPLYSCDHHHSREEIMRACKEEVSPQASDVVYIGDGPWDLRAARSINWGFVGIGSKFKNSGEVWLVNFSQKDWDIAPNKALQKRSSLSEK